VQLLAAKKNDLLRSVSIREQEAIAAVLPPGKRRLFNIRENEIRADDAERARTLAEDQGLLKSVASAVGIGRKVDIAADVEKARSADDSNFLQQQADRRSKIEAIERAADKAHHDIEDLTLDNIDAWKMTTFPN
jgi:hypothetical protein